MNPYFSVCIITLKYIFLILQGGMKSVVWTDVFQAFFIILGLATIAIKVNEIIFSDKKGILIAFIVAFVSIMATLFAIAIIIVIVSCTIVILLLVSLFFPTVKLYYIGTDFKFGVHL